MASENEHIGFSWRDATAIPREKKGLEVTSEKEIKCPGCHKHTVTITTVDEQDINLSHIVTCPYCGEESFITRTTGSYVYSYPDDNICPEEITHDDKTGRVKLYLRLRK